MASVLNGPRKTNRRAAACSRTLGLAVVLLTLAGCNGDLTYRPALDQLEAYQGTAPSPESFVYCYGHGCSQSVQSASVAPNWNQLTALFEVPASSAEIERQRLAQAVGFFETAVGARYGTAEDKGGTFTSYGASGQLDCIDEALNTSTFLMILEDQGLLAWHDVGAPVQRSMIIDRWPHATATIVDRESGQAYAVDSWFHDNGTAAEVVPVETWFEGWEPA